MSAHILLLKGREIMKIHGFQKMTLLDFPGKVACTVFTGGCNLRCPFCHNASLVTDIDGETEIKKESILDFLSKRHGLLDGVAITGGEPLLQSDIVEFSGFRVQDNCCKRISQYRRFYRNRKIDKRCSEIFFTEFC